MAPLPNRTKGTPPSMACQNRGRSRDHRITSLPAIVSKGNTLDFCFPELAHVAERHRRAEQGLDLHCWQSGFIQTLDEWR